MPALPGSLALTSIADGASIVAADHRNNYSAVQTAVNALIALFSNGSLDGEALVWDATNTKWVAASTLAAGRPRAPRVVTSTMAGGPPASPVDQDIWVATAVDANGTRWTFQYNAGSGSAFKWEFIGGPPTAAQVVTSEGTAAVGPVDLATVGPSITCARAGQYVLDAFAGATITVGGMRPAVSYKIGAAAAVALGEAGNDTSGFPSSGWAVPTITTGAGDLVKLQYGHNGAAGTATFQTRTLRLVPQRIS